MGETPQKHVEKAWAVVVGRGQLRSFLEYQDESDAACGPTLFTKKMDAVKERNLMRRRYRNVNWPSDAKVVHVEIREL